MPAPGNDNNVTDIKAVELAKSNAIVVGPPAAAKRDRNFYQALGRINHLARQLGVEPSTTPKSPEITTH